MSTRSASPPLCASLVLVQMAVLAPKVPKDQQSGVLLLSASASREAFCSGWPTGGTGPATPGRSDPPMTSCTVLTAVPCPARCCSQSSRALKLAGVIEYAPPLSLMWWKVSCTQPPLLSACVTSCWMSARVQKPSTESGARVKYGSAGGMVSATAQPGQPLVTGVLMSPTWRAEL